MHSALGACVPNAFENNGRLHVVVHSTSSVMLDVGVFMSIIAAV